MAQSIYSGVCHGGPFDGQFYTQITKPPIIAGCFNYESITECGSYIFRLADEGWFWEDDPIMQKAQ